MHCDNLEISYTVSEVFYNMKYTDLRDELRAFYSNGDKERSESFAEKCFSIMDSKYQNNMNIAQQKMLQYSVITEEFDPVIFKNSPFYYETGVLTSLSDGARIAKNYGHKQANAWVFNRNSNLFWIQNENLINRRRAQLQELFYLICGAFNDDSQHFCFNNRPILENGLKGIYEKAQKELVKTKNSDETDFLKAVCEGMLSIKRMAEKFSEKAEQMLIDETNEKCKSNLLRIASTAKIVPWEKPRNFYEALNTLAFMRKAIGSLEGVGPNTFGRLDMDLYPFYENDIKNGTLTKKEAYGLICHFLIIWDCHYDHDMKMIGYADHELENTYTLGGCDENGESLYNELTQMFLRVTREEHIIYPKIKCRFSATSPKEYMDEINISIVNGTSTVLFENDDAVIPALLRAGRTIGEARDYIVSGCWDIGTYQEKHDCGNYLNLLKPFEFAIHNLTDKMEKVNLKFDLYDDCKTFEDVYVVTLKNCEKLIKERIQITKEGGQILHRVDLLPIFSSTLENCLENHKDYSQNGAKYRDDYYYLFGFPNIIDSLLAIKELVFDKNLYTIKIFLNAVRSNWDGYEDMRLEAIHCHGWGDGSKESCGLAKRFNDDLFNICEKYEGGYGGKVNMGYLTYTEIRSWGERTLATPDGRKNGEYFAQGLTPSRLKKIPNVTDVINSMRFIDKTTMAANSVVNIILPNHISLDNCYAFLKTVAQSSIQALQLNCTTKEQLLDAQKHPEKYPNLIVRVTGFSAKFTSLSKEWQDEVISRNFYD